MNFTEKLKSSVSDSNSILCVGLDPTPDQIPHPLRDQYSELPELVLEFCSRIIDATKEYVCAFKPNSAFFEALGSDGWTVLEEVVRIIPDDKILIADAKRGDIGNTAKKYKIAFFDHIGADAMTLNPLMGMDTLNPYLHDESKAIFVLTMTSNRGAGDFLHRRFEGRMSLGEYIAEELAKKQNKSSTHIGMVVGATQIQAIEPVINAYPDAHLLIPGIGKQGGSIEELEAVLKNHNGIPIVSSSRSIIYAGSDKKDWLSVVSEKASTMKKNLQRITQKYV